MTITEKTLPIETHIPKERVSSKKDIDIVHNNNDQKDLSTYSKILAIYSRDPDTNEYFCIEEKQKCKFSENWTKFAHVYMTSKRNISNLNDNIQEFIVEKQLANPFTNDMDVSIKVSEYQRDDEQQIRGCIATIENENEFNDWFIYHILDQCRIGNNEIPINVDPNIAYEELFADFFAANLKNTIVDDEWEKCGRKYFIDRVKYFTDRYLKIECILPAFPCKSSNWDKVYGMIPDKGEELALRRLIQATKDVVEVYPPGMKIWIVSDGHVFSDCIGVDDDIVDNYTEHLHQLYEKVKTPGHDAIGFCGLKDLFFTGIASEQFDPTWVEEVEVPHYTGTAICPVSDVSRQILMKGCDTDDGRLRKQIGIDGHPRLHLYRGFSRFMMEDLTLLPFFAKSSRKGFKKIISKVAFNMIKRNDAYSNLVELLFPHHLRISIHAHTNSGPKYGIKVISTDQCRIVKTLDNIEEPTFEDLLHIPTPWHNCVVKVIDSEKEQYYLTKSKVIQDALKNGTYRGEWKETCISSGEGGHFVIYKE